MIGVIGDVVVPKYTMTQATLKKTKIPSASLELLDLSKPRMQPTAENLEHAAKCAGKASFIFDKMFKRADSSQAEKMATIKNINTAVWQRLTLEFTGWSQARFLYDELMSMTMILMLEDENSFIFGEDEFNKFLFNALPSTGALDTCEFSAEHNDYDTIDCLRIKFESDDLEKILAKINTYNEEIIKIARIFAMRQEEICQTDMGGMVQNIPRFFRCFSFFSYGNQRVTQNEQKMSTGCISGWFHVQISISTIFSI